MDLKPIALFLSTPSVRRATGQQDTYRRLCGISIHALREEGDVAEALFSEGLKDFYPRPPRGGRRSGAPNTPATRNFYPRPPQGGRQSSTSRKAMSMQFLSTPSARRATGLGILYMPASVQFLSTPSARRATPKILVAPFTTWNFYPRPPRGGRRRTWKVCTRKYRFLSTPSARRATQGGLGRLCRRSYFYPRPPRGGRLVDGSTPASWPTISIHALREEGDQEKLSGFSIGGLFLSTPSARRATADLSLHIHLAAAFLSTPSARRATTMYKSLPFCRNHFYPRPPRGGRRTFPPLANLFNFISIHALREEGD